MNNLLKELFKSLEGLIDLNSKRIKNLQNEVTELKKEIEKIKEKLNY